MNKISLVRSIRRRGTFHVAGHALPCALLEDGTRVVFLEPLLAALDTTDSLFRWLHGHLRPSVRAELAAPIGVATSRAHMERAIDAGLLPELLLAIVRAGAAGELGPELGHTVDLAEALAIALVAVGMAA
jgi:hypothetical protein